MKMELGKKIAALRKMKKVTQTRLAEYLSVNPQTISRWEAEGGMPDIMLLPKIATFFGVSLDELFGMTDMEQISNLVYKYSVLRDDKSFEEVMRSLDIALNSMEEELKNAKPEEIEELNQRRLQLQAWKVHIYIQKSRGALEQAEKELDELRNNVTPENSIFLSLKLQKQQFRIQMGETATVIKTAKSDWEQQQSFETLYCYIAALYDAQRSDELLQLWEKAEVQAIVEDINVQTEGLWQMMFDSAVMEQDLSIFEHYLHRYKDKASEIGVFEMEWGLAQLYKSLGMESEKIQLILVLKEKLQKLEINEYIKNRKYEEIEAL